MVRVAQLKTSIISLKTRNSMEGRVCFLLESIFINLIGKWGSLISEAFRGLKDEFF